MSQRHCRYWRHIRKRKALHLNEKRIVFKTGEFNIEKPKTSKCHQFSDLFPVFIKARWRWTLLYCVIAYVSNWLVFAIIWWIILYVHGDLEHIIYLPNYTNTTDWKPCVREIENFTSVFLFSIEIHTTIGYGKRAVTRECATAIFTMCIESIAGKILQSVIIGMVYAKLTRPKHRAQTLLFSKNIIVNQRDTNLSMIIFRVGNVRKSRIIGVTVAAYLIKHETVDEEDILNYDQVELKLDIDNAIFAFPITVRHVINENSPFYNISANDILKSRLEILVVFEGIIESTGQVVQAKSSYTDNDIYWGRRFVNPVVYRKKKRGFRIDYEKFDELQRINTPLCTARDLRTYILLRRSK